jgi:RNA polymerase sigma-70 factor (ECF subfamily)
MTTDSGVLDNLLQRVRRGDEQAVVALFTSYRDRLRRMVRLRLDRRLQGRIDPSDVLQDAYLDVAKRAGEYVANPSVPVFLWLRLITGQRLMALHRQHLGAQMRDAGQEVSLYRGALPHATSVRWPPCCWDGLHPQPRRHNGPRCRSGCRKSSMPWTPSTAKS